MTWTDVKPFELFLFPGWTTSLKIVSCLDKTDNSFSGIPENGTADLWNEFKELASGKGTKGMGISNPLGNLEEMSQD